MNKTILIPQKAEKIQNEIFKKMSAEKRIRLAFKINDKILKIAKKRVKSLCPNFDPISFSGELYK
ncbi:MAG: hypothetical protein COX35_02305, partial [Candidatus Nealsonbacteria bacterium CG23_combo_of_CG06-09_8_20_14_all_37_18]